MNSKTTELCIVRIQINAVYQARDCGAPLRLLNLYRMKRLPFPALLILLKNWGKQHFHTETPMYFGINSRDVLKQKILRQQISCFLIWEFFRHSSSSLAEDEALFKCVMLMERKSTVLQGHQYKPTYFGVFQFYSLYFSTQNSGSSFDKRYIQSTKCKYYDNISFLEWSK